jgi:hypothetical protein
LLGQRLDKGRLPYARLPDHVHVKEAIRLFYTEQPVGITEIGPREVGNRSSFVMQHARIMREQARARTAGKVAWSSTHSATKGTAMTSC